MNEESLINIVLFLPIGISQWQNDEWVFVIAHAKLFVRPNYLSILIC